MAASRRGTFLRQVYNHVVLPRDVPGHEDGNLSQINSEIHNRLHDAVKAITPLAQPNHRQALESLQQSLLSSKTLNIGGKVDKALLKTECQRLERNVLILHITAQNAGLLIYRLYRESGEDSAIFEAFETSAACEDTLAAKNALQWDFPGCAVSIPYQVFTEDSFQENFAAFLDQSSREIVLQYAPVTYKAAAPLPEIRDTTDPALITGMLMSILEANGTIFAVPLLRKRVRDTVSFKEAHKPWRRSPFYLVLRVAIQRHLYRVLGSEIGRLYYKVVLCVFISRLLNDCLGLIIHEASHVLRMKLGFRLSKLETDYQSGSLQLQNTQNRLLQELGAVFEGSLSSAQNYLERQWEIHKAKTRRPIHMLPGRALDSDKFLRLPRSGRILDEILNTQLVDPRSRQQSPAKLLEHYENSNARAKPFTTVARRFTTLSEYEENIVEPTDLDNLPDSDHRYIDNETECFELASVIQSYISTVGGTYDDYPDLKSRMLLKLMELWVAMDQRATATYRLLLDYHPGFDASMLDTFQLLSIDDVKRVREVQTYLSKRCNGWRREGSKTIFDSPRDDSFAARYYDNSDGNHPLKELHRQIENDVQCARDTKEEECRILNARHEELKREIAELSCTYVGYVNVYGKYIEEHESCRKCWLQKQASHMKIGIFEYPLPRSRAAAKAAIFELICPKVFAAYRDATWLILACFAYPKVEPVAEVLLVHNYSGLHRYAKNMDSQVTLGSFTKPHLNSHYKVSTFPVTFQDICRACGLKLGYFDNRGKTWIFQHGSPSFTINFPIKLPHDSPYRPLGLSYDNWPSSNKILASQTECPSDMNIHEFTAWQGLLCGTYCRWLSLLRELGSANINFSTDSSWAIVSRLISQVGPASLADIFGHVHSVFRDSSFCKKLLEQISFRLESIRRNWREPVQMDLLTSILLKTISFASNVEDRLIASRLLKEARDITWSWLLMLQEVADGKMAGPPTFTIWAAVLCKRTAWANREPQCSMDLETVQYFIGASFLLENNLVGPFDALPFNLRNAVLHDLIHTHGIRCQIRDALKTSVSGLVGALNKIWPVPKDFLEAPVSVDFDRTEQWAFLTFESAQHSRRFYVHYHLVLGTLLIDGQQLGSLPSEYRLPIIQKLFGTRHLLAYRSPLPGMSLVLKRQMPYNHWIHLGFRGDRILIRAQQRDSLLEFIPNEIFQPLDSFELPASLVVNCYHWLNLKSGMLEVRQDDIWKSKPSNWSIDLRERCARRRTSVLVDPNSHTYTIITQNFHLFEKAEQITVFQPQNGNLAVELKRLELSFFVNKRGLLQCHQLGVEIVESKWQDPGIWYGLLSKIVVRSTRNRNQRSILVPIGRSSCEKDGQHVRIVVENQGAYLKFGINNVLGRLDCPAEPRLLYTRVLWHAYTSHFLPDPLTGRTGAEEAIYYLRTGLYQPWSSISHSVIGKFLNDIAILSPRRVYYPPNRKCMETVTWNPKMTIFMQDDRYVDLIQGIFRRLNDLSLFAIEQEQQTLQLSPGDMHLRQRRISRDFACTSEDDLVYIARDRRQFSDDRKNVIKTSQLLAEWPTTMGIRSDLGSILQKYPIIGGYHRTFDKFQISDLLSLDLGVEWGALAQTALSSTILDKYRLMFLFSPIAFSPDAEMELILGLLSFALIADLKQLKPPLTRSYTRFESNQVFTIDQIALLMTAAQVPYTPLADKSNVPRGLLALRRFSHESEAKASCERLAQSICAQWPNEELNLEELADVDEAVLDANEALKIVKPEWTRLTQNFALHKYFQEVQLVYLRCEPTTRKPKDQSPSENDSSDQVVANHQCWIDSEIYSSRSRGGAIPSLRELLQRGMSQNVLQHIEKEAQSSGFLDVFSIPDLRELPNGSSNFVEQKLVPFSEPASKDIPPGVSQHVQELQNICISFGDSRSNVRKRYAQELNHSIDAFIRLTSSSKVSHPALDRTTLSYQTFAAKASFDKVLNFIRQTLKNGDARARWLELARIWPNMSPIALLTELSSTYQVTFGDGSKEALISLGVAITNYQRLLRINDALLKNRQQQLHDERNNRGHQNWSPSEYPDWLLLEIDSDILIRPEQVEVAEATISPPLGENSVLQLLMGKGKTSCILPMVALVLANKRNLCRIVVPRALLLQSAQVMQSKLGMLLNREVIHIPFSRKTPTSRTHMETYFELHRHLMKHGGVMLALPEHLMSFKLSGLQRLSDNRHEEASCMIKVQAWLNERARDVLDECDVSLAIRTQLIYPSGSLMTVDGHPLRWQTTEVVLRLVRSYLPRLQQMFPRSVEVVQRTPEGYPLVYFLRKDIEDALIVQLADGICRGQTSIIPITELSESDREDIRDFITSATAPSGLVNKINAIFKDKLHLIKVVYLLRGLFVCRILISSIKKRWNVQYGLHPMRDPIAVPYHAKGVPSPSSEWGHPDVAIILTCLSFYYQGLDVAQFKQAFAQLLKTDEPSVEYEKWASSDLPEAFRDYTAINVEDNAQLRDLHAYVHTNVNLLDFYINSFVFPKHARQFETKLQASSWDLVQFEPSKKKNCRTTGFSGTNDSRHQLPMTIKQNDLPNLLHTNAEVLSYLLEARNRGYVLMVDSRNGRLSEESILAELSNNRKAVRGESRNHPIRVLIDAGAQILEHDNKSLAKAWLKVDNDANAAVYFDSDHRPRVVYKKGTDIPLVASPFADDLENCVVYLDESHCRGTDLKLPANAVAALTLGPHLSKDALVQAAMRLRLLGQTQSIIFFSPPEVHQSIMDLRAGDKLSLPDSSDVIRWLLEQTCNSIEQLEPLYYSQGMNYLQRAQAKIDNPAFLKEETQRARYMSAVRAKELQTLKQLYEPKNLQRGPDHKASDFSLSLRHHARELLQRRKDFQDGGIAVHSSAFEEVEQEREVEFEVESVREVHNPVHFAGFGVQRLHKDIKEFATTGRLPAGSDAYEPMFCALQKTALAMKQDSITATATPSGLFVSTQFSRTVQLNEPNDNFLRPCQWILWSRLTERGVGLIVSPEEANSLIPILRKGSAPTHLIIYSTPVTRRMLQFNNLDYHATPPLPSDFQVPPWMKIELGIFAGRLYFSWDEYEELLGYLSSPTVGSDGSCHQSSHFAFAKKPLAFLHEWLAVRRKGQDYEHTPMGYITTGKPLSADHSFFLTKNESSKLDSKPEIKSVMDSQEGDEGSDNDDDHEEDHFFDAEDDHTDDFSEVDDDDEFNETENTFFDSGHVSGQMTVSMHHLNSPQMGVGSRCANYRQPKKQHPPGQLDRVFPRPPPTIDALNLVSFVERIDWSSPFSDVRAALAPAGAEMLGIHKPGCTRFRLTNPVAKHSIKYPTRDVKDLEKPLAMSPLIAKADGSIVHCSPAASTNKSPPPKDEATPTKLVPLAQPEISADATSKDDTKSGRNVFAAAIRRNFK
ncbi:hypothetical protein CC78DRAFT_591207 [Lojkania enalia]|uniref:ubiquitinyl hydrolase 1 n=1 Tax=Lojkania enalia TaxID=147567 RepID=A0A9P4KEM2_9PLEO|nr:hypothetical protein CC78DRAFT_591207 [Didymosphaeria enalia]